ncbi:PDZ domain-containing protein [Cryobacterium melibiosiphilum]|uniref:PDZ domain-containing protein n=1 Tax=Cryobacterium melibiosiphilum TaxID=995039 RepID=A0A3A5MIE8_9MICO|nr:trypsin-like peptidase domain-containing protein [Cryobacterium melibiosiphilum]RJT88641.1 PDZ domain-containing protein [Cryobacterium melibiosiphilum]RJT89403.1 PDZ domain-containing protein [Cryobacterium melibiosiphilum]
MRTPDDDHSQNAHDTANDRSAEHIEADAAAAAPYVVVYEVAPDGTTGTNRIATGFAPPSTRKSFWRSRTAAAIGVAAALIVGSSGIGYAVGQAGNASATSDLSTTSVTGDIPGVTDGTTGTDDGTTFGGPPAGFSAPNGVDPGAGFGPGSSQGSSGSSTDTSTLESTAATDAQSAGIVLIETELDYESSAAAGTGVVLSSDGLILTNNHVIEGSTSISVTIATTGDTYTAEVVGTDSSADIAVLQLLDASGLTPADLDTTSAVAVGDAVTGVGNAGGTGELTAAAGAVTALDETITAQNSDGSNAETLSELIEVNAQIESGDSGGPLLDADGEVIGINTAASSGTATVTGYAITIENALDTVAAIESGVETDTVTIGYPAFLGVAVGATATDGSALLQAVIAGTPAAAAGLVEGDTITAVDGVPVTGATLSTVLQGYSVGDAVAVTWTDAASTSHTASVTLIAGPAD